MAFWKENTAEPTRKFRFKLLGNNENGGDWYWVKSLDKPSFEVSTTQYTIINQKFEYPGILTWNDINIVMADIGDSKVKQLQGFIQANDYKTPDEGISGVKKSNFDGSDATVMTIQQLDSSGAAVEEWELFNTMIKSVNYGSLAYSDDDLVEITMIIAYDYAKQTK
jgi:hypothetical protein